MRPYPQDVPTEMLNEIALGMAEAVDLAWRHGIDEAEFRALERQGWFQREIANRRARYESSGFNLRRRWAANAETLLEQIYLQAMAADDAATKLDVAKYLAKLADMEPKNNAPVLPPGDGFSITINLAEPKQSVRAVPSARARDEEMIEVEAAPRATVPMLAQVPFESLSTPDAEGR